VGWKKAEARPPEQKCDIILKGGRTDEHILKTTIMRGGKVQQAVYLYRATCNGVMGTKRGECVDTEDGGRATGISSFKKTTVF